MKNNDGTIGNRIKAKREEKRMTQEELAEKAGISISYMSEIENKKTIPSFSIVCSLFSILNISLDDIIFHVNTDSDTIKRINRLISQCNEKKLSVIQAMITAMLNTESEL